MDTHTTTVDVQADRFVSMTSEEAREIAAKACKRAGANLLGILEPERRRYVLVFEWRDPAVVGSHFDYHRHVAALSLSSTLYAMDQGLGREHALKEAEDIWRDAIRDKIAASK